MSTWISRVASATLWTALAACVPAPPDTGTSSTRSVSVLNGSLNVAAAPGYCIDRPASRETDAQAVIVIGRCSDRSGGLAAIVTVAVGAPGSAVSLIEAPGALADYFASGAGRATLSRDGDPASVRIRSIRSEGGRLVLHLDDAATGETWRTLFGLRGRLVSVSVTGAAPQGGAGTAGKDLLDRSTSAMLRANPGTI